ncbi:hypothetical protein [Caldimonas tepidiphila]|uniref:hypothetical protein n=1 Tax=Caldimonas tepidiphila TaxID=2315841 RepID=UPI000E5C4E08|nr:hypothetical protein [Caldimonas tepidiphila]
MASTTVNLHVAARHVSPRGARPLGELAALVFRAVGRSLTRAAERRGSRLAAVELRRLAWSFESSKPELAADLRAAAKHCESVAQAER